MRVVVSVLHAEIPAGANFTPGLLTKPETEKDLKPVLLFLPNDRNHLEPFSKISLIQGLTIKM